MSIPLFYPVAKIVAKIDCSNAISLKEVCAAAGVSCRASGDWTERSVVIEQGQPGIGIVVEPGYKGAVLIGLPQMSEKSAARIALGALAYGLMDLVARESIRGASWARLSAPPGRPKKLGAKSNSQRQRNFQMRARAESLLVLNTPPHLGDTRA